MQPSSTETASNASANAFAQDFMSADEGPPRLLRLPDKCYSGILIYICIDDRLPRRDHRVLVMSSLPPTFVDRIGRMLVDLEDGGDDSKGEENGLHAQR